MLLDWLWLTTRKNLGVRRIHMLLDKYGSPEEIYRAPAQDMEMLVGRQAAASLQDKSMDEAEQIAQACFRLDVRAVTIRDASYPQRLRSVDDAPVVLYYQGRLPQFELMPAIAMVGTRRPSGYGFMKARQFGTWLGEYGVIVVSGGAAGVDTECLSGALEADAPVVAVLGCGVDICYPAKNERLFADIRRNGCLLSEYPPGSPPIPEHFPARNRIISGLCNGVLIVEAPERSGALITAEFALEQGRDVFALAGTADNPSCAGNLRLVKEGAALVSEPWDVLREYSRQYPKLASFYAPDPEPPRAKQRRTKQTLLRQAAPAPLQLDTKYVDKPQPKTYIDVQEPSGALEPDERTILAALQDGPVCVDDVIDGTQLPAGRVLSCLTMLEVKGYVKRLPARRYERTGKS